MRISRFKVSKLFGEDKVLELELLGNVLVLVGENGTGKSTILNLLFYLLTKQYERLLGYEFATIEICINAKEIVVPRIRLQDTVNSRTELYSKLPPRVAQIIQGPESARLDLSFLRQLAIEHDIPLEYLLSQSASKKKVSDWEQQLTEQITAQVLYLPTYRRIEQDLATVLGVLFHGPKEMFDRYYRRKIREESSHVELVEFGMEDVEKIFRDKVSQLKDKLRKGLSHLTGAYLKDLIRGEHEHVDDQQIRELDPVRLRKILQRIDASILPALDKENIQQKIKSLTASGAISNEDKIVAHFLKLLMKLNAEQQEAESSLNSFITVCNAYLVGKEILYDNLQHEIYIETSSRRRIELRQLSSGEKQIVSLFSLLYLKDVSSYFVIIDEPELSLSVPWQRRFLPDVSATPACVGLIAVTHSPFIFDNKLSPNVRSLEDFEVNA